MNEGLSLSQYAAVRTAELEGFARGEVLRREGVAAAVFARDAEAWDELLTEPMAIDSELGEAHARALDHARSRYGREIEPLETDADAWFSFHRWFLAHERPDAALARVGLRMMEVVRLLRLWSARAEAEPALAERGRATLTQPALAEPPLVTTRPRPIPSGEPAFNDDWTLDRARAHLASLGCAPAAAAVDDDGDEPEPELDDEAPRLPPPRVRPPLVVPLPRKGQLVTAAAESPEASPEASPAAPKTTSPSPFVAAPPAAAPLPVAASSVLPSFLRNAPPSREAPPPVTSPPGPPTSGLLPASAAPPSLAATSMSVAPPTSRALPFAGAPPSGSPAARPPVPAPPDDPSAETTIPAPRSAPSRGLPFAPGGTRSSPPPSAAPPSSLHTGTIFAAPSPVARAVTPFASAGGPRPAERVGAPAGEPAEPVLSLEQLASLFEDVTTATDKAAVLLRYRITAAQYQALEFAWAQRVIREPELGRRIAAARETYRAWKQRSR